MLELLKRRWIVASLIGWLVVALMLVWVRIDAVHWFALSDTDDNLRMLQVRDLLNGQDWYDLRQYRLNPPQGFDIHWSHLVDLPIAGLILLARLFVSGGDAERFAILVAPLLPMIVMCIALAATVRKLISPVAHLAVLGFIPFAQILIGMFAPTRIDHHNWQLALLAVLGFGLVDDRLRRGGMIAGLAMAASYTIGMELLPYLLVAGCLLVARWALDPDEAPRLERFGLGLGLGVLVGYFGFASYANAAPRCDALTPVWLTTMLGAAFACLALSRLRADAFAPRAGAALAGGLAVGGFYALVWPQCLGMLEGISPELKQSWLAHISEARPIYRQTPETMMTTAYLPAIGLIGYAVALWRSRGDAKRLLHWLPLALLSLVATSLLLFQSRVGAASQLLALPGAVALAWYGLPWFAASKRMIVRVLGIPGILTVASGALGLIIAQKLAEPEAAVNQANVATARAKPPKKRTPRQISGQCATLPALKPIAQMPKARMFTFVDLGPRLVTVTHHTAPAGPYHRNGDAILDVHKVFDGSADRARTIIAKHKADFLLLCPGTPESTIYAQRSPNGFYKQLTQGQVPDWLERVPLPKASPFVMWRVKP